MPAELATIPKAAGRFTGERIARTRPRIYRKVIALLAAGVSVNEIANSCRVSEHSVNAIGHAKAITIEERKSELAAMSGRIAANAGEQIENALAAGKVPIQSLPVVLGIATDKLMLLSDQPTARIKLDVEVHDLSRDFQALHAEIINTMKQANAIEIPNERPIAPSLDQS